MEIRRGDIFYVRKGGYAYGSEQDQGRPAVIVSNDTGNYHSNIVEVVYLTTQEKKPLPTHVDIMCKVPSTALCEQITNVSQERLGEYVRSCTVEEMDAIDRALMILLGIDVPFSTSAQHEIDELKMKLEGAERELEEVKSARTINENALKLTIKNFKEENDKLKEKLNHVVDFGTIPFSDDEFETFKNQIKRQPVQTFADEEKIKIKAERDLYKSLYEQAFERLVG